MVDQPSLGVMDNFLFKIIAVVLFIFGGSLVLGAYYQLGITGTYLGDYFGILMKERVTGFPFTVMNNPMYMGSTILFLAHALWLASPIGIALTALQFVVYRVALLFEEYVFNCFLFFYFHLIKSIDHLLT